MVFDSISWGEIFVVGAVGAAMTGRKDLPAACRYVGSQLGRVVGLLQGARARADQFATNNELRQLQNELRSGLRELDQVKSELAVAASSQGMVGRSLGGTTSLANRQRQQTHVSAAAGTPMEASLSNTNFGSSSSSASVASVSSQTIRSAASPPVAAAQVSIPSSLPPAYQTERAVMEEEWEKRGIGFRSVAEQGAWMGNTADVTTSNNGSELLANLIKDNLIFDQYDRVVGAQEAKLEERIEKARNRKGNTDENSKDPPVA
jgi:Sec-independent protein translocase protein TatA